MKALWARTWFRATVGMSLALLAAIVGAIAGFSADPRLVFFIEAPLTVYQAAFLFIAWAFVLIIASHFRPVERKGPAFFAAVAMMMFAGVFRELDTITPWGLTQALACAGLITWAGFGRLTPKTDKGENA